MVKIAKILLILVLLTVLTLSFFRHSLCLHFVSKATAKATGLELDVEELNLDILNSSLYLGGVTLFNPPGFSNPVLGKARKIFIEYDLLGSIGGRLHFRQVKPELSEINIIRNEKGTSNISVFGQGKIENRPPQEALPASSLTTQQTTADNKTRRSKFLIDRLELSLEKATFTDYQAEIGKPAVIIFTTKGPLVFREIGDLSYVVDSMSAQAGFRGLLDSLLGKISVPPFKD